MRVFLVSHSSGLKGPINFLEDYLQEKKNEIFHLEHPLDTYHGKKTILYHDKNIVFSIQRSGSSISNLFKDFFISLTTLHKYPVDIYIGSSNFDTLPAIFLRVILRKKYKKIIYFAADFSPNRFKNMVLNKIYYLIETVALRNCDIIVSNTVRAEEQRIFFGLNKKKSIVIPNGVYLEKKIFQNKIIQRDKFIYIGNVTQEHGIYDFIKSNSKIIKKLTIIGQGDQWNVLRRYCEKMKIPHEFIFKLNHEKTITYLQKFNGLGLAPYTSDAGWTKYSSPLKVNEYIACGVPVIISNVPEISAEVASKKLGIVYSEGEQSSLAEKISKFDTINFYKKAEKFYNTYSYSSLYNKLPL